MAQAPKPTTPTNTGRDLLRTPRDLYRGSPVYRRARDWSRWCAALTSIPLARFCGPRFDRAFGVLMYHRVTEVTSGMPAPSYNVPPARFRSQLAGLLRAGYQAWPLRKIIDYHDEGRAIPRKTFVVTFDDGYASVHQYALPILEELRVPATVFLATAYLDSQQPFPADDWTMAGTDLVPPIAWKPLSTAQCRELQASGLIELGAHTHTHQDFRGRAADLYLDLLQCLELLKDRFNVEDSSFAFPYGTRALGFCTPEMAAAVQAAGARCAFSTDDGLVLPHQDRYSLGRMEVDAYDTGASLAARLSGWTGLFQHVGTSVVNVLRGRWQSSVVR